MGITTSIENICCGFYITFWVAGSTFQTTHHRNHRMTIFMACPRNDVLGNSNECQHCAVSELIKIASCVVRLSVLYREPLTNVGFVSS
jgi:hypothetical protein